MAESPSSVEEEQAAPASPRVRPARAEPGQRVEHLPPHVVFLHNDPHNSVEFVIAVLQKVLTLNTTRAIRFTLEAHKRGRCAVWSGHKELAELKAQQITAAGPDPIAVMSGHKDCPPLKATVEQAPG